MTLLARLGVAVVVCLMCWLPQAHANSYLIGSYYFPGWSSNQRGSHFKEPWRVIEPFPERQPRAGWYADTDPSVLRRQADDMRDGGLDFVVFDSYWDQQGAFLAHAAHAYRKIWKQGDPLYALMWANHFKWVGGQRGVEAMLGAWIQDFMSKPGYLHVNGKPVLFVFSIEFFEKNAREIGIPVEALGELVQKKAREAGLPGVFMVGGAPALAHWVRAVAPRAGFSAITAYNYHFGYSGEAKSQSAAPSDFSDLAANYRQNWQWLVKQSDLPYIVPMTSGWDKTPWLERAKGQRTYQAIAKPEEFGRHLQEARELMDRHPDKTLRMGIICCWNEFGEGSYIEPTRAHGSQVLDQVRRVFKSP